MIKFWISRRREKALLNRVSELQEKLQHARALNKHKANELKKYADRIGDLRNKLENARMASKQYYEERNELRSKISNLKD